MGKLLNFLALSFLIYEMDFIIKATYKIVIRIESIHPDQHLALIFVIISVYLHSLFWMLTWVSFH